MANKVKTYPYPVKEKQGDLLRFYQKNGKEYDPGVILGFPDALNAITEDTFRRYIDHFWYFEYTEDKDKEKELLNNCKGFYVIPDWRLFASENDILLKTIPYAAEQGKGIVLGMDHYVGWGEYYDPRIGTFEGPKDPYIEDTDLEYNHFFGALITNYLVKLKEYGTDRAKEAFADALLETPVLDGEIESFSDTPIPDNKPLGLMAIELAESFCPAKDFSEKRKALLDK